MTESKSVALPLGYSPRMGRPMGIEPTNAGATIRCVNHFATAAILILAGAVGIEPTLEVLETSVLPLNYAPIMVEGDRFELPNPQGADLQSAAFSHFATPPYLIKWCRREESNPQPTDYKSVALPIELHRRLNGGSRQNRTADTRIFSPLLYRLSYRANYCMAVPTGIEPAISCVTGRHVNHYTTEPLILLFGCGDRI